MSARVLSIITRMNVGGPARVVNALARRLPERFDHKVVVGVADEAEGDFLGLDEAAGLRVTRVQELQRELSASSDLRALRAICREIRDFRPHIVHTHTAKAGVLGRAAAIMLRVPIVIHTFHGHLLYGYFPPKTVRAIYAVERCLAVGSTSLVAVGMSVRDDLLEAGVGRGNKYVIIPPGVSMKRKSAKSEARRALGIAEGATVIAFVARLTEVKRPDRLVEVARRVCEVAGESIFIVAGDGPLLEETVARAEPLGDRVRFLGFWEDLDAVYSAADIALLTSDNEGTPVSLIEAGAYGVPGIAPDVGSVRDVVCDGQTGIVTPATAESLAGGVVELLDADKRARYGFEAAQWARRRFSTNRLVEDTAALYDRLMIGVCGASRGTVGME